MQTEITSGFRGINKKHDTLLLMDAGLDGFYDFLMCTHALGGTLTSVFFPCISAHARTHARTHAHTHARVFGCVRVCVCSPEKEQGERIDVFV